MYANAMTEDSPHINGFPGQELCGENGITFKISPWARWKVRADMLIPFPACTWML